MIRDRIEAGVRNSALSLKLQLRDKLTLEEAVTYAGEAEMIKKQQPLVRDDQKESARVGVVNKRGGWQDHSRGPRTRKGPGAKQTTNGQACTRCGKSPPHDHQHCPARDAICHNCSKRGHYKAMCKSSKKVRGSPRTPSEQNEDSEAFLGAIETDDGNPWIVSLRVRNEVVDFHINTGAEVSVIPDQVYRKLGSPTLTPPRQTLRGPGNEVLPVKGQFSAKLVRGNHKTEQELYVVEGLHRPLLG